MNNKGLKTEGTRLANWDVLRTLMMFLVVVVHMGASAPIIQGHSTGAVVSNMALICDPIFFMLSGYFSIRALKGTYRNYIGKKAITVVLPMVIYALISFVFQKYLLQQHQPGFFAYLVQLLRSGYWFIPALLPFLLVAPLLYRMLGALKDREVLLLTYLALALFAVNIICSVVSAMIGGKLTGELQSLVQVIQTLVQPIAFAQFFVFFIFGYVIKRLALIWPRATQYRWMMVGSVAWITDSAFVVLHIRQGDPSFLWMFTTMGVFLIVDWLKINSQWISRVFEWTAKRSYAVYLTQFALLPIISSTIYGAVNYHSRSAFGQSVIWIAVTICVYLSSLLVATVVDGLVSDPLQRCLLKFNHRVSTSH